MKESADIEQVLAWAYRDQKVDLSGAVGAGREWNWLAGGMTASGAAAGIGMLGARVDGGGVLGGTFDVHPDAIVVDEAVVRVCESVSARHRSPPANPPGPGRGLVIEFARAGERPDWMPGARFRCEPEEWRDSVSGRSVAPPANPRRPGPLDSCASPRESSVTMEREAVWRRNKDGAMRCIWSHRPVCQVVYRDPPSLVLGARAVWALWREQLVAIAGLLRDEGRLERWEVTGPEAAAMPWGEDDHARWASIWALGERIRKAGLARSAVRGRVGTAAPAAVDAA